MHLTKTKDGKFLLKMRKQVSESEYKSDTQHEYDLLNSDEVQCQRV